MQSYMIEGALADGAGDDYDVIEIELTQALADRFGLAEEQDIAVELDEDGSLSIKLLINLAPLFVDMRVFEHELAQVLDPFMHEYGHGWR